ncbi:MAG: SBBP repeat-containing protein [Bacteroidetes bacterium]|nr:SBBP repeat-containing protein [Bacteroidota bacterium]
MRKSILFKPILLAISTGCFATGSAGTNHNLQEQARQCIAREKILGFQENKGQIADVDGNPAPYLLFKAQSKELDIYITDWGLSYVFIKVQKENNENQGHETTRKIFGKEPETEKAKFCRADMVLEGARILKENIIKEYQSEDYSNYYLSYCKDGILNVRRYGKITIKEIYPKIDWVIYTCTSSSGKTGEGFKYDFIIHPGGNPGQIILNYKWTDKPDTKNDGSLSISTPLGKIIEGKPYSYIQETHAQIQTTYAIDKKTNKIQFTTGNYNPEQTFIIDPNLTWGTYYGGSNYEGFCSVAADVSVNMFITGYVAATNFPTQNTGGGTYFQGAIVAGNDVCMLKFTNTGVRQWSTYYGGSMRDGGYCIAVDGSGNVFVTGETSSADFPTFDPGAGAYYQGVSGGGTDVILLKFSNTGVRLWATYYGGAGSEIGHSIITDGSGNVFATGETSLGAFPTLNPAGGAWFQAASAGNVDVFILKFNNTGVQQWATYYGGAGRDYGKSLCTDNSGNVFVTGWTDSPNFPMLNLGGGAYFQGVNAGGFSDILILKFNNAGVLLWSTYYGGTELDQGESITTDNIGNIFIGGQTGSFNVPTLNPGSGAYFQGIFGGGLYDLIILKFGNGGILLWGTLYGGSGNDTQFGGYQRDRQIITDCSGNVYVTGCTTSNNFPTFNPGSGYFVGANSGGGSYGDVFILQFNNNGVLYWSSYNGTAADDHGNALAVDPAGCLFLVGEWKGSGSNGVLDPSAGAYYDNSWNGSDDSFIMKFCSVSSVLTVTLTSTNNLCSGQCTGKATANPNSCYPSYTYLWSNTQATQTATGLCTGIYTVTVTDASSATVISTVTITQPPALTSTTTQTNATCGGGNNGSATVIAGGGTGSFTYTWSNNATGQTAFDLAAISYTVTVIDANGCTTTTTAVIVSPPPLTGQFTKGTANCAECGCKEWLMVNATGGTGPYSYSWPDGYLNRYKNQLCPGTYLINIKDKNGCSVNVNLTAP